MGQALFNLEIPVTKTSSALTAMTKDEVAVHAPSACIRCGRCVSVCPSHVVPQMMMDAAERSDIERFTAVEWYGMLRMRLLYVCVSCKEAFNPGL